MKKINKENPTGIQVFNHAVFGLLRGKPRMTRYLVWTPQGVNFLNMAVRKMPRTINANIQLTLDFNN